jgi:IS30 family transposase
MSDEHRLEVWDRWSRGDSISDIARAVNRAPGSIFTLLRDKGGYVPPIRRRRAGHLSLAEREEISRGLASGEPLRAIATRLKRAPSTISREIKRNKGPRKYRAIDADDRAWRRARRPKPCLLSQRPELARFVAGQLSEDWSPQQISGYLAREMADQPQMQVSHETIYKTLFVQSRGVLAKELQGHLRTRRPIRRSRHSTTKGLQRSQIKGLVPISERPAEVKERTVVGHWEGDLIMGRGVSQIATVVERSSRYTVLVACTGRDTATVVAALSEKMATLPSKVRKTLTWDRGMELASHHDVTKATGLDIYFADARSPWQRGTNENTNGLLRQYFPKGVSMAGFTQDQLDLIAAKLNARPRKTLEYATPAATLACLLR